MSLDLQFIKIASEVLSHLTTLINQGKNQEAALLVERFKVLAEKELDADKRAAEEVLERRFGKQGPDSGTK